MIVMPALDLRDGACVQLVGGSYADERIRVERPIDVARSWAALGFATLHVVDLDAATGAGSNAGLIEAILDATSARVSVGGGVRSTERIAELLDRGASRVVVGTRALEEPDWIAGEAARFPGRLVVAADVRHSRLTARGWRTSIEGGVAETIAALGALPIAGILVTAVDVEGTQRGPALDLVELAVGASAAPIIASGGVGSIDDLKRLAARGAAATVIGMALYSGSIDPAAVAAEFRETTPGTSHADD
jgi:phosphoribosylformimino-5-aminoimidazole carboxamide ribotide isomerase